MSRDILRGFPPTRPGAKHAVEWLLTHPCPGGVILISVCRRWHGGPERASDLPKVTQRARGKARGHAEFSGASRAAGTFGHSVSSCPMGTVSKKSLPALGLEGDPRRGQTALAHGPQDKGLILGEGKEEQQALARQLSWLEHRPHTPRLQV